MFLISSLGLNLVIILIIHECTNYFLDSSIDCLVLFKIRKIVRNVIFKYLVNVSLLNVLFCSSNSP